MSFLEIKNDEEENYDDVVFRCRCCSSIRWFVIVVVETALSLIGASINIPGELSFE